MGLVASADLGAITAEEVPEAEASCPWAAADGMTTKPASAIIVATSDDFLSLRFRKSFISFPFANARHGGSGEMRCRADEFEAGPALNPTAILTGILMKDKCPDSALPRQ
jgi:hypothetical protein